MKPPFRYEPDFDEHRAIFKIYDGKDRLIAMVFGDDKEDAEQNAQAIVERISGVDSDD